MQAQDDSSRSFNLLDERIRRWIWQNEWTELRDIQEKAVPIILNTQSDVILAAPTAGGKTEAAFFPVLTSLLYDENRLALYISPLSALINDQFRRIGDLCEKLGVPIHPWHGDISYTIKKNFIKNPHGVLLITPESLQALFCLHGIEIPSLLGGTRHIVIDELHSFIGSERGKQLQTLLFLIEERAKRHIPRIGLSATLGAPEIACEFLSRERECVFLNAGGKRPRIKILLKGVTSEEETADYLFPKLLGGHHLIFPNSRSKVELYTHLLSERARNAGVPNEFFAHHGNLSKEIRDEAEEALRSREHGATVICTNTLELGIDIGEVESVVQIECPPSVASLRQRLGRSGRRPGTEAVLRAFSEEKPYNAHAHPFSQLRESTFSLCASIMLLLDSWCEAPRGDAVHFSTLVQQLLSLVMERSGVTPEYAYETLCVRGPFRLASRHDFMILVKALITQDILELTAKDLLLLGEKGEKRAAHRSFYAAFASETEYYIATEEKILGTLPVNTSVRKGDFIIFAGQTWKIKNIDDRTKTIAVKFFAEGKPPVFTGGGWNIHKQIRRTMRMLYESEDPVPFADTVAGEFISEGRRTYFKNALFDDDNFIIEKERYAVLFTWLGDRANRTLQLLFRSHKQTAYTGGPGLTVPGMSAKDLRVFLDYIAGEPIPEPGILLEGSQNLLIGKWDWTFPDRLLKENYALMYLDYEEIEAWLKNKRERRDSNPRSPA